MRKKEREREREAAAGFGKGERSGRDGGPESLQNDRKFSHISFWGFKSAAATGNANGPKCIGICYWLGHPAPRNTYSTCAPVAGRAAPDSSAAWRCAAPIAKHMVFAIAWGAAGQHATPRSGQTDSCGAWKPSLFLGLAPGAFRSSSAGLAGTGNRHSKLILAK